MITSDGASSSSSSQSKTVYACLCVCVCVTSLWTQGGAVRPVVISRLTLSLCTFSLCWCSCHLNIRIEEMWCCLWDDVCVCLCMSEDSEAVLFSLAHSGMAELESERHWFGLDCCSVTRQTTARKVTQTHHLYSKQEGSAVKHGEDRLHKSFFYSPLSTEKWTPSPEQFDAQWSCKALNCFTRCNRPAEMSQKATGSTDFYRIKFWCSKNQLSVDEAVEFTEHVWAVRGKPHTGKNIGFIRETNSNQINFISSTFLDTKCAQMLINPFRINVSSVSFGDVSFFSSSGETDLIWGSRSARRLYCSTSGSNSLLKWSGTHSSSLCPSAFNFAAKQKWENTSIIVIIGIVQSLSQLKQMVSNLSPAAVSES